MPKSSIPFSIRMSPEEYQLIKSNAQGVNMSMNAFMVKSALDSKLNKETRRVKIAQEESK